MAKKKNRPTVQVRMFDDLAEDVRVLADGDTAEYLDRVLRPVVDRELKRLVEQKTKELEERRKGVVA